MDLNISGVFQSVWLLPWLGLEWPSLQLGCWVLLIHELSWSVSLLSHMTVWSRLVRCVSCLRPGIRFFLPFSEKWYWRPQSGLITEGFLIVSPPFQWVRPELGRLSYMGNTHIIWARRAWICKVRYIVSLYWCATSNLSTSFLSS